MTTTSIPDVIIGVDTHKDVHAAVAISSLGVRLAAATFPANRTGYQALEAWAIALGSIRTIGIEGTGSYGAGLSRFLHEQGHVVLEVNRHNRQLRHQKGKSDTVDAESAARVVLSGQATSRPKSGTSSVEMRGHQPTVDYVRRRTAEGRSKSEIIRCLKRYVAREIFGYLCNPSLLTDIGASTRSPKPSTAFTRPRSSVGADHGNRWRPSSSQPLNGSIGSTTDAF